MASLQDLEAQLQAMKKRKAELSADIRRAAKRMRREHGGDSAKEAHVAQQLHQAGEKQVGPKIAKGAASQLLVLVTLAGSCVDAVVSFVLGSGRPERCRTHKLEVWNAEVRRLIADGLNMWYLSLDFSVVLHALDGPQNQVANLCRYIVEYYLWMWLLELNCKKGVKPGSSQLLAKACSLIPSQAPAAVTEYLQSFFQNAANGGRSRRRWIASFRQRWKVKPGLLKVGEDLKPAELLSKAALLSLASLGLDNAAQAMLFLSAFLDSFSELLLQIFCHFGALFLAEFGDRFWAQFWVQFWVQFLSPLIYFLMGALFLDSILAQIWSQNWAPKWCPKCVFFSVHCLAAR